MDNYSEYPSDFDLGSATEVAPEADVTEAIGTDERRMHVRAYNYWVSLLAGRDYPSIEDLEPGSISDFAPHSVLLDFTAGRDNPATPYVGAAIRAECGLSDDITQIDQVPSRSLLSRLTDHYLQIIANRAPIGFEAEFVNQRSHSICYRGILMPFSSDGDTIDFIYGVINWKDVGAAEGVAPPSPVIASIDPFEPEQPPVPDQADQADHIAWEDGPLADQPAEVESRDEGEAIVEIAEEAGLGDRLAAARNGAEVCKQADGRSRAALYRALALAYDFAVAAKRVPDDYAEILEEAGVKAQARAPMTPIVKLVFGIGYDKTRLTEFAAALSYAQRNAVDFGGFLPFVEAQAGGLKALVAAERDARRPDAKADDGTDRARAALRERGAIDLNDLTSGEEFCLVVTRRGSDGIHQPVAVLDEPSLLDRAIRRAAR